MEPTHALQHVRDLRARIGFLRPMRADSPPYKLWLGDIVELANTCWGAGSPELEQVAAALRPVRAGPANDDAAHRYLARLSRLDGVLAAYEEWLTPRSAGSVHP